MFCCCCCCFDFNNCSLCGKDSNIGQCCSFITQKVFQIIYISAYIFLIIFLIATISIINFGKLPKINLTLFLILLFLTLGCLILVIFLYYYTQKLNPGQYEKKKISLITTIGIIFTVISLILCIVEEVFFAVNFSQAQNIYSCNDDVETSTSVNIGFFAYKQNGTFFDKNLEISEISNFSKKENKRLLKSNEQCYSYFLTGTVLGMSYFTFTMIEIISIFGICFWSQCKKEYAPTVNNYPQQNYIYGNQGQNQNLPQQQIQPPQIIIVNQGNNGQYSNPQQYNYNGNNSNTFNPEQQNNYGNNYLASSQQKNNNVDNGEIIYPSKESVIFNNISEKQGQNNAQVIDYPSDRKDFK